MSIVGYSFATKRKGLAVPTIDFDCNGTNPPLDVVATLNSWVDLEDGDQMVSIIHITSEGLIVDFYQDGELVRTIGRTWEEWFHSAEQSS